MMTCKQYGLYVVIDVIYVQYCLIYLLPVFNTCFSFTKTWL